MNSTNNNNDMAQLPKEKETQLFAGFEILIQNIVRENNIKKSLIQRKNLQSQELERDTVEKADQVKYLIEQKGLKMEQTRQVDQSASLRRSNIERLRQHMKLLDEHEASLKRQLTVKMFEAKKMKDKLDVLNQSALDGKIKQKEIYQSIPLVCDLKRLRMKLKYGNEDKQDDNTAPGQTAAIGQDGSESKSEMSLSSDCVDMELTGHKATNQQTVTYATNVMENDQMELINAQHKTEGAIMIESREDKSHNSTAQVLADSHENIDTPKSHVNIQNKPESPVRETTTRPPVNTQKTPTSPVREPTHRLVYEPVVIHIESPQVEDIGPEVNTSVMKADSTELDKSESDHDLSLPESLADDISDILSPPESFVVTQLSETTYAGPSLYCDDGSQSRNENPNGGFFAGWSNPDEDGNADTNNEVFDRLFRQQRSEEDSCNQNFFGMD